MILHTNNIKARTGHFPGYLPLIIGFLLLTGCKKLIDIQDPRTQVSATGVYSSDANAKAAIYGLYSEMYAARTWRLSATSVPGLTADEITTGLPQYNTYNVYFNNQIISNDQTVAGIWTDFYKSIYNANAIIEGVAGSTGMTDPVKKQFTGEAKFVRAINHFYLVNLFGPVPLILTTDVKQTVLAPRADSATIYNQIIADLTEAQTLLSADYSASGGQRTRVNKFAAAALLARVYLHTGNFAKAEEAANVVLGSSQYSLLTTANMNGINLKNNKEAIFQFDVTGDATLITKTSWMVQYFVPTGATPADFVLRPELVNSFEAGDLRLKNWTGTITYQGTLYYYLFKYQQGIYGTNAALNEYHTVLRLDEQYLVRAEARAKQGNLAGGLADLNIIRKRAGLADTTAATQGSLVNLIMHERQVELFCDNGLRWLDLKRTGTVDAVIGAIKPTYKPFQKLYPIPIGEMQKNPALTQNPGY